jgi:hypothetical protein
MTWVGLVCLALRSPTNFWTGGLFLLTLLILLTMILVAVYRAGRTRAFAVGFLVFGAGYLACLAILAGSLNDALRQGWTPVGGVSQWLFSKLHPPIAVQQPASMMPGGMGMGMMGGGSGSMPGGEGGMGSSPGGYGGYGGPVMPGGAGGMVTIMQDPPFDPLDFHVICNLASACLLGALGGAVAQMLHATRPRPGDERDRTSA